MKALEAVRFLLELCLIVALAIAGAAASWWLAVLLPFVLIGVWGVFIAPKSARRLGDPARLVVEIALFAIVGGVLATTGHAIPGIALAAASTLVAIAVRATGSRA